MGLLDRLFGRKPDPRAQAEPEEVVREHFAAMVDHDVARILATLTPERGRLYSSPAMLDKKRLTVRSAQVLAIDPAPDAPVEPAAGYGEQLVLRVEYELELVPPEERRDPSLAEGPQWAYFLLVREGPGRPWLIADWGR